MSATATPPNATSPRINFDVFDVECAARGATDETARGELVGVDRGTVWRWRTGRQAPSLETVTRIAQQFEIPLEKLLGTRGTA